MMNAKRLTRWAALLCLLPALCLADAVNTATQGLHYAPLAEGGLEVVGYEGDAERVIVPCTEEGEPIVRIGEGAFEGNRRLTHVLLPEGITSVGDRAFKGCTSLKQIHLGDETKTIGAQAFAGCTALETLILPKGLIAIGEEAFAQTALRRVSLPDSVETVGDRAFDGILTLGYVHLGSGLIAIGESAFAASPIRRVKLPESVQKVGKDAFAGAAYVAAESEGMQAQLMAMADGRTEQLTRAWPEPEGPKEGSVVMVTAGSARLRSAPVAGKDNVLRYVREGDSFPYVDEEDGWFCVRLPDGIEAWISQTTSKLVEPEE